MVSRSDYEDMNIEELYIHMRIIIDVLESHKPSYKSDAQDKRFRELFINSLLLFKKEQTVDSMINLFFDCNCVGYAIYPTRAELKEMIEKVF